MVWLKRALWVIVAVGVLVGAAELALRLILPGVIANAVRSELTLEQDHEVDVSLGGSALLHTLAGGVGDVTIRVPDAPLVEGLTADAMLQAARVPFDVSSGEIQSAEIELDFTDEQLDPVVDLVTNGLAASGHVEGDALVVGSTIELFGQSVELEASVGLAVDAGAVVVQPAGISVAGFDLTAGEIAQLAGSALDPVLSAHTVCVRDQLPSGVEITEIDLSSDGRAVVRAQLAPDILSDPAAREHGTCA